MTMTDNEKEALAAMDDRTLIAMWDSYKVDEDRSKDGRKYAEYLLLRRMVEREADAVASGTHDIRLTHAYDTDANALEGLKELVEPAMIAAAYTPPEQVWTDAKWNWTVLNGWRKYGAEVAGLIDKAKVFKPAQISIKRKPVKP